MIPNNPRSPINNGVPNNLFTSNMSDKEILNNYFEVRHNPWSQLSLKSER